MNTPNPLIPQGSLQSRGKSTVRIAFFTIAAIHVVFIGGLLMQGCKKSEDTAAVAETNTLPAIPPMEVTDTNIVNPNEVQPSFTNPPIVDPQPAVDVTPVVAPDASAREYVVAKGDSFSSIAKKMGVSARAIEQANPGVNSSRLKIGQKLQIPGANSSSAVSSLNAGAPGNGSGNGTTYTVKSGDMLEKIARRNGTTVKEIMRMNNLKTTRINVGQKLKLPSKSSPIPEPSAVSPNYVTPLPPTGTNP